MIRSSLLFVSPILPEKPDSVHVQSDGEVRREEQKAGFDPRVHFLGAAVGRIRGLEGVMVYLILAARTLERGGGVGEMVPKVWGRF